jgi:DNA-repair protein complementing XP-A cells
MTVDETFRLAFGVHICHECKTGGSTDYDLLNKSDAKDQYLLGDGIMATLAFIEKDNPRHSTWTAMKLYMRGKVRPLNFKRSSGDASYLI